MKFVSQWIFYFSWRLQSNQKQSVECSLLELFLVSKKWESVAKYIYLKYIRILYSLNIIAKKCSICTVHIHKTWIWLYFPMAACACRNPLLTLKLEIVYHKWHQDLNTIWVKMVDVFVHKCTKNIQPWLCCYVCLCQPFWP